MRALTLTLNHHSLSPPPSPPPPLPSSPPPSFSPTHLVEDADISSKTVHPSLFGPLYTKYQVLQDLAQCNRHFWPMGTPGEELQGRMVDTLSHVLCAGSPADRSEGRRLGEGRGGQQLAQNPHRRKNCATAPVDEGMDGRVCIFVHAYTT